MPTRISAGVIKCPCFSTFFLIWSLLIVKLPYTCLFIFFGNNRNIGEFLSTNSKERMTTNIIFVGVTPIN